MPINKLNPVLEFSSVYIYLLKKKKNATNKNIMTYNLDSRTLRLAFFEETVPVLDLLSLKKNLVGHK